MRLERLGTGKRRRILLNGVAVCPKTLEAMCRKYFTAQGWEELKQELERNGKVYVAAVFINNDLRLRDMLDDANKKIAALERRVAQLTGENVYLTAG